MTNTVAPKPPDFFKAKEVALRDGAIQPHEAKMLYEIAEARIDASVINPYGTADKYQKELSALKPHVRGQNADALAHLSGLDNDRGWVLAGRRNMQLSNMAAAELTLLASDYQGPSELIRRIVVDGERAPTSTDDSSDAYYVKVPIRSGPGHSTEADADRVAAELKKFIEDTPALAHLKSVGFEVEFVSASGPSGTAQTRDPELIRGRMLQVLGDDWDHPNAPAYQGGLDLGQLIETGQLEAFYLGGSGAGPHYSGIYDPKHQQFYLSIQRPGQERQYGPISM